MMPFETLLAGGDLRSIGRSNSVAAAIRTQEDFDALFRHLFHPDRLVVMRAADAVEKVTGGQPQYLAKHKKEVLELCRTATDKELKWHLALLLPRLPLTKKEFGIVWDKLTAWAKDKTASRIVRVHSVQGLADLLPRQPDLEEDLLWTMTGVEGENIPSLNARIRHIHQRLGRPVPGAGKRRTFANRRTP